MKARMANKAGEKSMLVNMAESIGSTLGKIAKKARAVEESALKLAPAPKSRGARKPTLKTKKSAASKTASPSPSARKKAGVKTRRGKKALARRKA